ncbi:FAD-dependent oxidoreductase [Streptomyces europaeiscabiei]|uniref:FAD-dependent oxidoreductase n=1 Tax=Streptomyces europaeiscabiei TaxID=146819 RepID=UPI000766169A|nr:FAD-dependent oxidoreductase [Streptomyces europaeiscabiei]MDX3673066.1 FAD-dependent oxidoreductase [Streptomyces europaeiscabiei]
MSEITTTGPPDIDVLVVGGGPTGLLTAVELLRRGIRVRVIDRARAASTTPKALSVWPRALDILQDAGLGDAVHRESLRINRLSYFSDRKPLASFPLEEDTACRVLPQHVTERLLAERLAELGGKVERGVRLLALEGVDFSGDLAATDGVTAVVELADGSVGRIRAPYVVGADGAGSAVRGQLGIGFSGSTYEMAFALVDARTEGDLPRDECLFYQAAGGALVVVPMPGGIHRFLSVMPQGRREVSLELMQEILDERGPRGVRLTEAVWQAVFRVHARHASDFSVGRVFLAGDAAHVHSPAGGQGMNNGLQDAQNLAWKLAAVIRGASPASLLASYGTERSEATRQIVRDTDLQTRAWVARSPAKVLARDTAFKLLDRSGVVSRYYTPVMAGRRLAYPPVRATQRPSGPAGCRVLGRIPGGLQEGAVFPRRAALAHHISGPGTDPHGWTLVLAPPSDSWRTEAGHVAARYGRLLRTVVLRRPESALATGCRRAGYWLVRPDGHIAAHGHEADLGRLEAELKASLTARPAAPNAT